jgi:cbb3-type cytochrome oxidase maturation protein
MDILLMLIPAALMISGVAIVVFYWSVKSGQFEDMDGEAHRILMDDDDELVPQSSPQQPVDKQPQQKSPPANTPGNNAG